jgi:hydrogenase nickel incorporation protein HypB
MCTTCGCSSIGGAAYTRMRAAGPASNGPRAAPDSAALAGEIRYRPVPEPGVDAGSDGKTIVLEQQILAKNTALAARNRRWLDERGLVAFNLMSSPGAGKTSLLERTIRELAGRATLAVVEGDQATQNDAERIAAAGAGVVQINTGTGCHLEADMLARALEDLKPPAGAIVMIENVGNLVCPALFDLGERARVVILSVTEGEDKPLKYPHMFRAADLMILNKIDLLPYLDFDAERCVGYALEINPALDVRTVSARTGEGMSGWYEWLMARADAARLLPRSPG